MRVLQVSNFYPPHVAGGAELVVAALAQGLARGGDEVTVVSTCGPGQPAQDTPRDGVRVIRFFPKNLWWNFERFQPGDHRPAAAKLLWNARDAWNADAAARFGAILDRVTPDLVHTHNIKGLSPAIWREARRRRLPIVHTAHDFHLLCRRGTMLGQQGDVCRKRCAGCHVYGAWYRRQARAIDLLCSPSRHVARWHGAFGLSPPHGTAVVRNGVLGTPLARPPRPAARTLRLLFLGQLRREKGVQVLLAALRLLACDIVVEIAGTGALEATVQAAAAHDRRLRFAGFVQGEAKSRLLSTADALVFPSIWSENAPLVIAEAFMHGIPVLASDIGAIPEFVRHGGNGMLFPPNDAAALAALVQLLAEQPELLDALSAGAARDAAGYTLGGMVGRYRDLYQTALAAGPQR